MSTGVAKKYDILVVLAGKRAERGCCIRGRGTQGMPAVLLLHSVSGCVVMERRVVVVLDVIV